MTYWRWKYRKLIRETSHEWKQRNEVVAGRGDEVQICFCCFLSLSFLFGRKKNMSVHKWGNTVRKKEADHVGEREKNWLE